MRSGRRASLDQGVLPFEVAAPAPVAPVPDPPTTTSRPDDAPGPMRCRLRNDALASRGWPAGTELLVDVTRRPGRGDVALVREGGRLKIGVFDRQLGRAVLRTDHGSAWLGDTARFVGVVTLVNAPLAGMPSLPLPAS